MGRFNRFGKVAVAVVVTLFAGQLAAWCQAKDADREKAIAALVQQGKLEDAVEACRAWIKDDAQATKPHLLLGDVYARLKLWDKAQVEFRTALELNPASATAYAKLGDLLRAQGKLDDAKQSYEQALRTNDKCLEGYLGLAQLCFAAKKPEEAQPLVEMAVQIAPDNAVVLAFAGELQRVAGKLPEAEALLKSALKKDPSSPDALWSLAACVQAQGRDDESQKLWDQFLAVENGTERAWVAKSGLVELGVKEVGGSPGVDHHPVFSPDGKYLAFAGLAKPEDERTWDLWVMRADGSQPAQCITTGGGSQYPRWTQDGKSLVFDFLCEAQGTKKALYTMPAFGGEPKCLAENLPLAYGGVPIPGTDRVLFTQAWDFDSIKCDGTGCKKIGAKAPAGFQIMYLSVSPNAQSVVFAVTDWPKDGQPDQQLYVCPLDGSLPPRQITSDDVGGRFGNTNPDWGPDGKRIMYSSDVNHPRKSHDVWVTVLGDPHPPYLLIPMGARATWSPDGTKVAFDRWTPKDSGVIFMLELGGKRLRVVKP